MNPIESPALNGRLESKIRPCPTPEEFARINIDSQLTAASWAVKSRNAMNLYASRDVAVREFPLETGEADYLLFVDRKAVGVVEAKPEGVMLLGGILSGKIFCWIAREYSACDSTVAIFV